MNAQQQPPHMPDIADDRRADVLEAPPQLKPPKMFKVLLLNDDYTPMEFVVHVLRHIFFKAPEEAVQIMLHVHQKGLGVCGVYTNEVAATKVKQVMEAARKYEHPLQCTMEPE